MSNPELLFVKIRDDVVDWVMQHGLSKTESKLFFYLLKLDRFGDRPAQVKVAEILLKTGISKTSYHAAIAKFQGLGWFDFCHSDVKVSNLCCIPKSRTDSPKSRTDSPKFRTDSPKSRTEIPKFRTEIPKSRTESHAQPLPKASSSFSQTIQTYSDFIQTLSDNERTRFINFCEAKTIHFNPPLVKLQTWLGSIDKVTGLPNYIELYDKFQRSPQEVQIRNLIQQQAQTERWESDGRLSDWLWEWSWFRNYGLTSEWINLAASESEHQERTEFASWAEIHGIGRSETQREEMPPSLIEAMSLSPHEQQKIQTFTQQKKQMKSRLQSTVTSPQ
ncbi:hypothetical protein PCC9214_05372 (plasmid) [Planktothrix tepida]|uniref:Uncharacterized protein n=1 Tax=Planktothrix tepida PCC 9214 TaxID=671072 RepID=A0A1J1LN06_9CYAN|nr:hypothetical protein [Planktothrix tepida]CAD5988395.1 hypothetical protein PCC9214_05372 [Planktothrix tepida]CUR33928.1 hypothetical protein PL921460037 [Planktothrix tepida PCC 9214]